METEFALQGNSYNIPRNKLLRKLVWQLGHFSLLKVFVHMVLIFCSLLMFTWLFSTDCQCLLIHPLTDSCQILPSQIFPLPVRCIRHSLNNLRTCHGIVYQKKKYSHNSPAFHSAFTISMFGSFFVLNNQSAIL